MRIPTIVRSVLVTWGALSLLGLAAAAGLVGFQLGPATRSRVDAATTKDVRFVLNWCELGDERIDQVLHSHVSPRSLTGDHLDVYAIRITHVTVDEVSHRDEPSGQGWWRGDQMSPVLQNAVALITGFMDAEKITWFPTQQDLLSDKFYVYPWEIVLHGT